MPYSENAQLKALYIPGVDVMLTGTTAEAIQVKMARETQVAMYSCPSDYPMEVTQPDKQGPMFMTGSYHACAGRGNGWVTWYLDEDLPPPYGGSTESTLASGPIQDGWRGPMHGVRTTALLRGKVDPNWRLQPEPLKAITDGSTNTLLAGESTNLNTRPAPGETTYGRRTFWMNSWGNYIASQTTPLSRTFLGDYGLCLASKAPGEPDMHETRPCHATWFALHNGGMNTARCDGSVHYVTFDIDLQAWAVMGSIADEGKY
jgi:prepilin-type processing-associated H-X9-DG protein